jgi:hypothetical protein
MQVSEGIIMWGVSIIVSAGVSYGMIKSKIEACMTREEHSKECRSNTSTVNCEFKETIAEFRSDVKQETGRLWLKFDEVHGMTKEILGYMRAKSEEK